MTFLAAAATVTFVFVFLALAGAALAALAKTHPTRKLARRLSASGILGTIVFLPVVIAAGVVWLWTQASA